MSAAVHRFPPRRAAAIFLLREGDAWLVLNREHGWLFGSRYDAVAEASRASQASGLPIRYRARS
jgi:hypothetical protein